MEKVHLPAPKTWLIIRRENNSREMSCGMVRRNTTRSGSNSRKIIMVRNERCAKDVELLRNETGFVKVDIPTAADDPKRQEIRMLSSDQKLALVTGPDTVVSGSDSTALSQKSASYVQIKTRVVETKAPLDEILANACGVDTASAVYMECVRKRKPHPFPAHRLYIEPSERS